MRSCIDFQAKKSIEIGFIPTMGALHKGHLSLISAAKEAGQLTICSIFVNPTQFNQASDFSKYPRNMANDLEMLEKAGCDVVFHPDTSTMYPETMAAEVYDFGEITNSLEGFHRPGHFNGVITIVRKLFDMVKPDHAYFGQKDYQQCAVVKEIIRRFNYPIQLHIAPIVREASGLAMSSRNVRLNAEALESAVSINRALTWMNAHRLQMPLAELKREGLKKLAEELKPEYLEIVDSDSLLPLREINPETAGVILIAVWSGEIRLIDNLRLGD